MIYSRRAPAPDNQILCATRPGPGDTDFGHQKGFWIFQGTPVVHPNNIANYSSVYSWSINYANIIGTVGAHELVHRITGIGDLPYSQSNPADLMSSNYNSNASNLFMNNGFSLTQSEGFQLQAKCLKKHPE